MRAAGTADVVTDDEAIGGPGGLGGRPVLVGLPGVRLDLSGGDRVRLAFEAGSPEGAEVVSFEQDRGADRAVARRGDRVRIGTFVYTIGASGGIPPLPLINLSFTQAKSPYFDLDGVPIVASLYGLIVSGIEPGVPYVVEAWIATGSPEISLRRLSTETIP